MNEQQKTIEISWKKLALLQSITDLPTQEKKSLTCVAVFHPHLHIVPDNALKTSTERHLDTHGAISSQRFLCRVQKSNGGQSIEKQTRVNWTRGKAIAEAVSFRDEIIENQAGTTIGERFDLCREKWSK